MPIDRIPVLDRTTHWVAVAKPSGIAVHRSKRTRADPEFVLQRLRDQIGAYVYPAHRLDRGTSGCLIFVFEPDWVPLMQEALHRGTKQYIAHVRGHMASREPTLCSEPLKRSHGGLQDAETWVQPVASCPDPRSSLVLAMPRTGRFHQVRRHLQHMSHPVLGDSARGDTRVNRTWRDTWGLRRLALHCLSIDIRTPAGRLSVCCPPPRELTEVWRALPWWNEAVIRLPELGAEPL